MEPSTREWSLFTTISVISASVMGSLEAMSLILRGIPNSAELAVSLIAYGSIGYGFCVTLLALFIYSIIRNKRNEEQSMWPTAICIPIGLFIVVLALSYLQGGIMQCIFFIPGSILFALMICFILRNALKRIRILSSVQTLLMIHIVAFSFNVILVVIIYNTGSWKWVGMLVVLIALGISSFVGFFNIIKRPIGLLVVTNVIVVVSLAIIPFWPLSTVKQQLPNILLITIDTLRQDHLGCYGYERAHTPNIDKIAHEGVMFSETVAPGPRTGPSHISILTGLYPHHHGAIRNGDWISDKVTTLPEILSTYDYSTAAFVSGWTLRNESCGLTPRFQFYDENFSPLKLIQEAALQLRLINLGTVFGPKLGLNPVRVERSAASTTDAAIRWLQRNHGHPFFLWVHYFDPHDPYDPPPFYRTMHVKSSHWKINKNFFNLDVVEGEKLIKDKNFDYMIALYDGEISYVDAEIGRLYKTLNDLQINSNTILLVTADHGESLGEHNYYCVHRDLYETCLRVPLIFNNPKAQYTKQLIHGPTRLIDIAPTILDLLNIDEKVHFDGKSLLPLMNGENGKASEEALASLFEGKTEMFCVRKNGFKLIWTGPYWRGGLRTPPHEELYNIQSDPDELNNILMDRPSVLPEMRKLMKSFRHGKVNVRKNLNEETKEKLRSLGYIQ